MHTPSIGDATRLTLTRGLSRCSYLEVVSNLNAGGPKNNCDEHWQEE